MSRLSVCLPFPGFYNSVLSAEIDSQESYMAEHMAEEPERDELPAGVTAEQIAEHLGQCMDYAACHEAIAEAYISHMQCVIEQAQPRKIEITFEEMTSPKFYNLETDRLFATVALEDLEHMRATTKPKTFAAVLTERHTSRSGFYSFYSNSPAVWNSKPLAEWDYNETGTLLVAWLQDNVPDLNNDIVDSLISDSEDIYTAVSNALDYDKLRDALTPEPKE